MQKFYFKEINRGIAGLGEYSIASAYKDIQVIPIENIPTYSPEEIVTNLRNGIMNNIMSTTSKGKEADSTQNEANEQKLPKSKNVSSRSRANEFLEKGNICFDNKLHCFMVKGTSIVLRVVTLFLKESCSCPSKGECYHLLAVRLSIGMTEKTTKFTSHNLTILGKPLAIEEKKM